MMINNMIRSTYFMLRRVTKTIRLYNTTMLQIKITIVQEERGICHVLLQLMTSDDESTRLFSIMIIYEVHKVSYIIAKIVGKKKLRNIQYDQSMSLNITTARCKRIKSDSRDQILTNITIIVYRYNDYHIRILCWAESFNMPIRSSSPPPPSPGQTPCVFIQWNSHLARVSVVLDARICLHNSKHN